MAIDGIMIKRKAQGIVYQGLGFSTGLPQTTSQSAVMFEGAVSFPPPSAAPAMCTPSPLTVQGMLRLREELPAMESARVSTVRLFSLTVTVTLQGDGRLLDNVRLSVARP